MSNGPSGPRRIGAVVNQLLARRGYAQVNAVIELQSHFNAAVPAAISQGARPGHLKNGVLEIIVADSSTMQELVFMRRTVLKHLQEKLPQSGIKDLKFKLGKL